MDFQDDVYVSARIGAGIVMKSSLISKLDANGTGIWAKEMITTTNFSVDVMGMDLDLQGNPYVSGSFYGDISVDTLGASGSFNEAFVIKYSPAGRGEWIVVRTGGGSEHAHDIFIGSSVDKMYVSGRVTEGMSITGNQDYWISAYDIPAVPSSSSKKWNLQFSMFPNPTQDFLHIQALEVIDELSVFDGQGKKVLGKEVSNSAASVDLRQFPTGIYLVLVKSGGKQSVRRVYKE